MRISWSCYWEAEGSKGRCLVRVFLWRGDALDDTGQSEKDPLWGGILIETELWKICLCRTNFDMRWQTARWDSLSYLQRTGGLLTDEETHTEVHGPVITSTRCVTSQKSEVLTYTAEEAWNLAVYIPLCRTPAKIPSSLKIIVEKVLFSTVLILGKNVTGARNGCVCKRMGWAVGTNGGEEKCV